MELRTVNEAWAAYEAMILASSKKQSQDTEKGRWENYIAPILGSKNICNLTTFDYMILKKHLSDHDLSPQTILHCLSLLRRVLNRAGEWWGIHESIPKFTGIMPKFDNNRIRYLTKEEIELLLFTINKLDKSGNWQDIVLFALNTGLRKGEIFNIKLSDVDFNGRLIHIVDTKSCKNRIIPLNDVTYDILLKRSKLYSFGEKIFHNKPSKLFYRAIKESGLNDGITDSRYKVVFHTLRHTFASWLVQEGVLISVVSELLGHSSLKLTMRYSHLSPTQTRNAVNIIGCLFK